VTDFRRSAAVALLSVVLAFWWQWGLVHVAFKSNWTALFCAGGQFERPPEIQKHEYVFVGSQGYDGQFYQLVAHDPLLVRHYDRFVDAPRLRYRRILMPVMANLFAAGRPAYVDAAYIAVCLLFVALGTFCLAQLAIDAGRPGLWGLLFLITPATLSALERMTVDVSLAALIPAVILAARRQRWLLLWFALAGAMLSKEIGVLVMLATVLWAFRQHKPGLAAALSSSVLPAAAWYVFVQGRTNGDYVTSDFTFYALLASLKQPLDAGVIPLLLRVVTLAAVAGLVWAAVRSIVMATGNRFHELPALLAFLIAWLVILFQNSSIWVEPNGFTRIYSPLLVAMIAATWRRDFRTTLALFAIVAFPLWLQSAVHLVGPLYHRLLS
jgi:hypothetical protein